MNTERFFEVYDRIRDAPDSVERMRGFVLELAVRGKLVEQDPDDEPASKLLKRIAAQKFRLVKKVRVSKYTTAELDDEIIPTYSVPSGWTWTNIAKLGLINPKNEVKDSDEASFVSMHMIHAKYGVKNNHDPRIWGAIKNGYTHFSEGDVGLAKITPCFENGKSTVFRNLTGGIGSGTTELHILRPVFVIADYVLIFLKCKKFIETGATKMTGTAGQKRVPADYFAGAPFPLPPLVEQHRIVAKVNKLMSLCDQIEDARTKRESTREKLTVSCLERLTDSESSEEEFRKHAGFVVDNIKSLTVNGDQIKRLRKTILDLAVRGKLVEQEPDDEPALELLKRISIEKDRQIEVRKIRTRKTSQKNSNSEWGFNLPENWTWARLSEIAVCLDYMRKPINKVEREKRIVGKANAELFPYYGATRQQGWIDNFIFDEELVILGEDGVPFTDPYRPKAYLIAGKTWVNNHAHVFRGILVSNPYLVLTLNVYDYSERVVESTRAKLNQSQAINIPVPLPPLAEQDRIVKKVDELMTICKRLEDHLTTQTDGMTKLLDSVLFEVLCQYFVREESMTSAVVGCQ